VFCEKIAGAGVFHLTYFCANGYEKYTRTAKGTKDAQLRVFEVKMRSKHTQWFNKLTTKH
jgi:hypothetical protein